MAKIYINIGSNQGDRARNLAHATALISQQWPGAREILLAPVYTSQPWGYDSPNEFYNLGLMIDTGPEEATPAEALDALHRLQAVEKAISPASHRNPDGSYRDRIIDIDMVTADSLSLDTPELVLPHPHLQERPFFLEPYRFLLNLSAEN